MVWDEVGEVSTCRLCVLAWNAGELLEKWEKSDMMGVFWLLCGKGIGKGEVGVGHGNGWVKTFINQFNEYVLSTHGT